MAELVGVTEGLYHRSGHRLQPQFGNSVMDELVSVSEKLPHQSSHMSRP